MATPRTCCALEHRFQTLSINHESLSASLKEDACFHPTDDITMHQHQHQHQQQQQHQNQNSSQKCPSELTSMPALPPQWEQFLDLKTGELYFYDWSAGRKTKTDPREHLRLSKKVLVVKEKLGIRHGIGNPSIPLRYSEVEDNTGDFQSMDEDSDDSEDLQIEASEGHQRCESESEGRSSNQDSTVLVAAGCQSCLMYYMLPKHAICCPKCGTSVLHFNEPATSKGKDIQEASIG